MGEGGVELGEVHAVGDAQAKVLTGGGSANGDLLGGGGGGGGGQ